MKLMCLNGEEFPVKETRRIKRVGEFFYWIDSEAANTWYVSLGRFNAGLHNIRAMNPLPGADRATEAAYCILDMEPITLAGDPII